MFVCLCVCAIKESYMVACSGNSAETGSVYMAPSTCFTYQKHFSIPIQHKALLVVVTKKTTFGQILTFPGLFD